MSLNLKNLNLKKVFKEKKSHLENWSKVKRKMINKALKLIREKSFLLMIKKCFYNIE